MSTTDLDRIKRTARESWAAGDYDTIARLQLWPVGERIVAHAGVGPGDVVLDVACGTGNAALRAALAGASVVGLDLTPELFAAGRAAADELGVEVGWVEGDAEALPFEDARFDVVLSSFGCMFAPRQEAAARELARVLRPGGRLAVCSWTPASGPGQMFRLIDRYVSPDAVPADLWGSEEHVRALFAGTGVELSFTREVVDGEEPPSVDAAIEFFSTTFGPLVQARALTEADGRWDDLRAEAAEIAGRGHAAEYLVVLGRKR